jgi:hypothetical protein
MLTQVQPLISRMPAWWRWKLFKYWKLLTLFNYVLRINYSEFRAALVF